MNTHRSDDMMSLRECAEWDHRHNLRLKLTGWGKICKQRQDRPDTRKARVAANREKALRAKWAAGATNG